MKIFHALFRALGMLAVRIFYRDIVVAGSEHIPQGPTLFVANHPNGLLDPLIVRIAVERPVAMLAKSTLFGNPVGKFVMESFDAIPVYRARDGEDTHKNDEMFARCRQILEAQRALALFPEGTSHSDSEMKPLKTGAARIALSAEAHHAFALGVQLVPVGLFYEDKATFRSRVAATLGPPIALAPYHARYQADERATAVALTQDIDAALSNVVLQADSQELWRGLYAVAGWTDRASERDLAARQARAQRLADGYRQLRVRDPERAQAIVAATRRFVRVLGAIGVTDPFDLERTQERSLAWVIRSMSTVLLLAPVALIGTLLGYLPYRLLRPASRSMSRGEADVVSTLKIILGLITFPVVYLLEAALVAHFYGALAGIATFLLAPLCGFIAISYAERIALRRQALRNWWLRATKQRVAETVRHHRKILCDEVDAALATLKP